MINQQTVQKNLEESIEFLNSELRKLRAGRANPDMVKDIRVNAYGSLMPIDQLSNINIVDSSLITITPWDKSLANDISKAIQASELGINPSVDGALIRLPLPPMTTERRQEYVKLLKQKVEEARIAVRQKRKELLIEVERMVKEENLPQEQKERDEKMVQAEVDKVNKQIDDLAQKKESELLTV